METVLPVIIEVVPSTKKKGYSLKHNQKPRWKGIIGQVWAWYKYKEDTDSAKKELTIFYNKA